MAPSVVAPTRVATTPPPPVKLSYDITTNALLANDGPLEPRDLTPLRPSTLSTPLEELRRRYRSDGYVFVKRLLPREDVLRCREKFFGFLAPTGVLKPGSDPADGIFDAGAKSADDYPGIGTPTVREGYSHLPPGGRLFLERALKAHTEDWYAEDLVKHPALVEFVGRFSGWADRTVELRRSLLRNNIPGTEAIGVHYDQIFLRHGEPTSITAWVPLGDIPVRGGGLMYLERSPSLGAEMEERFFDEAAAAGMSDEEARYAFNGNMMTSGMLSHDPRAFGREFGRRWMVADYEAGDVVLHGPYTMHASAVNQDERNVIRLATDIRFADSSKKWDSRWMKPYDVADGL